MSIGGKGRGSRARPHTQVRGAHEVLVRRELLDAVVHLEGGALGLALEHVQGGTSHLR